MKRIAAGLIALVFTALVGAQTLHAAEKPSADQAKALVEEALAYYKAQGREATIKEVSNAQGKFVKGELYVVIQSVDGTTLAHGTNPKLIGKHLWDIKDPDGKYFVRELSEKAKAGGGWVDYRFTNPQTKTVMSKSSYARLADDLVFICGIYK